MVRRQHRQQWRQYWRDGLDEMGLDALVEAAAWQCLHYSVLVPRLDWFLFWCVFFEMIIRMILDAKITKSNSAFWLSQITALVFFIQIEWVPWTAQAKLCGSSSKFPQWPPKVVIFGWGAKHRDMKVRREVTEVTIDNEVLRKAIEISALPRSRGAKFHNLSCTLSNHGQCLDDASESKFFSELRMKNHSWWKNVDCYTLLHWFIDYMSNMISTIQISILKKIPLHTDTCSWLFLIQHESLTLIVLHVIPGTSAAWTKRSLVWMWKLCRPSFGPVCTFWKWHFGISIISI